MKIVGAYEAKTHLSSLLDRVEKGEHITIAKHGVPVAMLIPAKEPSRRPIKDTIRAIRDYRVRLRLKGLSVKQLIEEGRR